MLLTAVKEQQVSEVARAKIKSEQARCKKHCIKFNDTTGITVPTCNSEAPPENVVGNLGWGPIHAVIQPQTQSQHISFVSF
jgi:hypothetical protein